MEYIHIISTRFNVPTQIWATTRIGKKPLSEEWLKDRFEIFQQYCLPSFINQSNRNFVWLVFFDKETPDKYLKIIADIQQKCVNFHPVFVQDFEEMSQKLVQMIPDFYLPETKFVISSDIDNDDLLHQDFVENVQKLFRPIHNLVIDLRRGLQLTRTSVSTAFVNEFYTIANPFVSIVENKSDVKTVIKEKHPTYRNYPDYVFYDEKPMFIQFIHANNLVNDSFQSKRISSINFKEFGIAENYFFKISAWKTFWYNASRIPAIAKRIVISKFIKR